MAQLTWNELKDNLRQKFPTVVITAEQLSECLQELDAVPVVRCKDCRWSCWNNRECIRNRLYRHNSISLEGESYFRKIEPDDFCSFGERREDADK